MVHDIDLESVALSNQNEMPESIIALPELSKVTELEKQDFSFIDKY